MAALASGCGTTRSEIVVRCPAMPVYSDAQMDQAAVEYEALDGAGVLRRMIDDYGELRARCRAIAK